MTSAAINPTEQMLLDRIARAEWALTCADKPARWYEIARARVADRVAELNHWKATGEL